MERGLQGWRILNNPFPNNLEVHTFILVDQHVPEARHATPRDLGRPVSDFLRDPFGGFPQDFKAAQYRVLGLGIAEELVAAALGVAEDSIRALDHLDQVQLLILHRGTASARIRSRMYQ